MKKIQLLSPLLVNQIAAGECIERPASVVKELVENSLDAKASDITIEIEEAGNRLIQVIDNGQGMSAEDLPMALLSHATSKLSSQEDLDKLFTLGFRGEALASISSIAEVELASRQGENLEGYQITASNGKAGEVKPVGMPPGTRVSVHDLFFNIPARRKFLKKKSTEMGHITDTVIRLALAAPQTTFRLFHNGRTVLAAEATEDFSKRIRELIDIGNAPVIATEEKGSKCQVKAYLASPEVHRPNGKLQFVYINNRSVRDKVALRAFTDGYKDYLPPKRQPIGVIYLDISPGEVDVNVHPTKAEVRYTDGASIYRAVYHAVVNGLKKHDLTPEVELEKFSSPAAPVISSSSSAKSHFSKSSSQQQSPVQEMANWSEPKSLETPQGSPPAPVDETPPWPEEAMPPSTVVHQETNHQKVKEETPSYQPSTPQEETPYYQTTSSTESWFTKEEESEQTPSIPYWQVHDSYLIVETSDGIEIVDQHALHERIIYSRLRDQLRNSKVISQMLLFPVTLKLTGKEMAVFYEWQETLGKLGIEAEVFGPSQIIIRSLPQVLGSMAGEDLVHEILQQLAEKEQVYLDEPFDAVIEMMSCKAAIKAGEHLNHQEIESLLKKRHEADNPHHCPHGRPTTLKITLRELEKHFKRR